jgi:hypothetical protein
MMTLGYVPVQVPNEASSVHVTVPVTVQGWLVVQESAVVKMPLVMLNGRIGCSSPESETVAVD